MDQNRKVRENRARRALERQYPGLRLKKTRRRDPHAADFGRFEVVNAKGQQSWQFWGRGKLTLEEIEAQLYIGDGEDS